MNPTRRSLITTAVATLATLPALFRKSAAAADEANSADLRGGTFPVSSIEVIPLGQTKTYYDGVGRVVQMDRIDPRGRIVSSTSYSYTHCPTTTPPSKPGSRFGHNP